MTKFASAVPVVVLVIVTRTMELRENGNQAEDAMPFLHKYLGHPTTKPVVQNQVTLHYLLIESLYHDHVSRKGSQQLQFPDEALSYA